ncbi:MAG: DUF885 domain-containing protein, partial [Sphingomonadaceae bacterium]
MMRRLTSVLLLAAAAAVTAPVALAQAPAAPAAPATSASPQSQALRALFARSDEEFLKRNPLFALFRGDQRYADQFGDYITDAYFAAERAAAERALADLRGIDRSALSPR